MASFYENLSNYSPTGESTSFQNIVVSGQVASQTAFIGSIKISTTNMGNIFDPDLLNLGTGLLTVNGNLTTSGLVNGINIQSLDTSVVKLTGNQTIAGDKTFSGNTTNSGNLTVSGTTALGTTTTGAINVTGTVTADGISVGDAHSIYVGADNDLEIVHRNDGSQRTDILETGGGNLRIAGRAIELNNDTGTNEYQIVLDGTGSANRTKLFAGQPSDSSDYKLMTTATGVDIKGTITADGVALADNKTAGFGTSEDRGNNWNGVAQGDHFDLEIFHEGSNSYIKDYGTGNLAIEAADLALRDNSNNRRVYCTDGASGSVALYYGDSSSGSKLDTTATGITVTGSVTSDGLSIGDASSTEGAGEAISIGAGGDLKLFHKSDVSYIHESGASALNIQAANLNISTGTANDDTDPDDYYRITTTAGTGYVRLYHGETSDFNAHKFQTTSTGVAVTGTVTADNFTLFRDDNTTPSLEIFTDSNNDTFISERDADNGSLKILGTALQLRADDLTLRDRAGNDLYLKGHINGATNLYYDYSTYNTPKLATTATGIDVTGTVTADGGTIDGNLQITKGNKLIIGDGSSSTGGLEIYHQASENHTIIKDSGTGHAGGSVYFRAEQLHLQNEAGDKSYLRGLSDSLVIFDGKGAADSNVAIRPTDTDLIVYQRGLSFADAQNATGDASTNYTRIIQSGSANTDTTLTLPITTGNLLVDDGSGNVNVTGTVTADAFTGSQTPNIQSGNETMSGHVGEKTICAGATGTVTYTFPDVADGDKGDTWTVVNASDQSITCARSSDTQFSKLVAGSDPATATSVTVSKGGVAEFVVTAANVITVFGSGIS